MQVSFGLSYFLLILCLIRVKILLPAFSLGGYAHVSILSQERSEVCHPAGIRGLLHLEDSLLSLLLDAVETQEHCPVGNAVWSKPLPSGRCWALTTVMASPSRLLHTRGLLDHMTGGWEIFSLSFL